MNPTVANLEPKLQEAYNRVMGTPLPQRPAPTPQQTQPTQPQAPTFAQVGGQPATTSGASKRGIPWWIYILAGVTFFALYTLFWARMFNINLF